MSVPMVGQMRNDFVFVVGCVMREQGSVFYRFARDFLAERSSNVEFGE
jgi:hypothetical protein